MKGLKHAYIQVNKDGRLLYGGNQDMMQDETMHHVGCGVISSVDALLYMHLHHANCRSHFFDGIESADIVFQVHEELAELMRKKFLPLIPHFGINGLELMLGINAYLRKYNIPYKAQLGGGKKQLFDAIDEMLEKDIPVILSIGPNFPLYWGKKGLPFYTGNDKGEYFHYCSTKAHYVTVTGADENLLRISSWGRQFFIKKQEYTAYAKTHSIPLFNTIINFIEAER